MKGRLRNFGGGGRPAYERERSRASEFFKDEKGRGKWEKRPDKKAASALPLWSGENVELTEMPLTEFSTERGTALRKRVELLAYPGGKKRFGKLLFWKEDRELPKERMGEDRTIQRGPTRTWVGRKERNRSTPQAVERRKRETGRSSEKEESCRKRALVKGLHRQKRESSKGMCFRCARAGTFHSHLKQGSRKAQGGGGRRTEKSD